MTTQPRSFFHYDIRKNGEDVGYFDITDFDNDRWDGESTLFDGTRLGAWKFSQYRTMENVTDEFLKHNEDDGYELWGPKSGHFG